MSQEQWLLLLTNQLCIGTLLIRKNHWLPSTCKTRNGIFYFFLQDSHHSKASIETIDPNGNHHESVKSSETWEESQEFCALDFSIPCAHNEGYESPATLILTEEWKHMQNVTATKGYLHIASGKIGLLLDAVERKEKSIPCDVRQKMHMAIDKCFIGFH